MVLVFWGLVWGLCSLGLRCIYSMHLGVYSIIVFIVFIVFIVRTLEKHKGSKQWKDKRAEKQRSKEEKQKAHKQNSAEAKKQRSKEAKKHKGRSREQQKSKKLRSRKAKKEGTRKKQSPKRRSKSKKETSFQISGIERVRTVQGFTKPLVPQIVHVVSFLLRQIPWRSFNSQ